MRAEIEFLHGLKITMPDAMIYRERQVNGETVIVSDGSNNTFILFKGIKGYYLRSPKLFRKSVPVRFVLA